MIQSQYPPAHCYKSFMIKHMLLWKQIVWLCSFILWRYQMFTNENSQRWFEHDRCDLSNDCQRQLSNWISNRWPPTLVRHTVSVRQNLVSTVVELFTWVGFWVFKECWAWNKSSLALPRAVMTYISHYVFVISTKCALKNLSKQHNSLQTSRSANWSD